MMNRVKQFIMTTLLLALVTLTAFADSKAEEIARKNSNLKEANDSFSISTMVIIDKNNNKKIRKIENFSKEGKSGRNSFIHFLEPSDVKGTKFLTIGHRDGDDEQRLYLPALGKVRRISSSKKGGSFMGSDLNYFDMEDHEFEDFSYKYVREEIYEGMTCDVIEQVSKDPNAPYSRQLVWISRTDNFAYKIECYEQSDSTKLSKIIVMKDVKNINGVLIPTKLVVDNKKKGSKTLLQQSNIQLNTGLNDSIFSIKNLTN